MLNNNNVCFNSVPEPLFEDSQHLFGAAQQLAFALLIESEEDARIAYGAKGVREDDEAQEDEAAELAFWAKSFREEIAENKHEMIRALVKPAFPLLNTHIGFVKGPLEETPFPCYFRRVVYTEVEKLCGEAIAARDPDRLEVDAIVQEIVTRGLPWVDSVGRVTEEQIRPVVDDRRVRLLLNTSAMRAMVYREGAAKDDRPCYVARTEDGRSLLFRARSLSEAQQEALVQLFGASDSAFKLGEEAGLRVAQIPYDSWTLLGELISNSSSAPSRNEGSKR